jgi:hypothetical protein
MICKNCGAKIRKRESYCPKCGMELTIPYSKSLKEKYIAGKYSDNDEDNFISRDRDTNPVQDNENHYESSSDYQDSEYEHYPENEDSVEYKKNSSGSIIGATILFLAVALLIGFVIGMIIFSGSMQSIPGMPTIK